VLQYSWACEEREHVARLPGCEYHNNVLRVRLARNYNTFCVRPTRRCKTRAFRRLPLNLKRRKPKNGRPEGRGAVGKMPRFFYKSLGRGQRLLSDHVRPILLLLLLFIIYYILYMYVRPGILWAGERGAPGTAQGRTTDTLSRRRRRRNRIYVLTRVYGKTDIERGAYIREERE